MKKAQAPSKLSHLETRHTFSGEAAGVGLFGWIGAQVFSFRIVEAAVEGRSEQLRCEIPSQALDRLLRSCCSDAVSSLLFQQTTSISAALKAPPLCPTAPPPEPFEYYDAGNHWCHNCNVTSGSMFDFFTHCHSKSHRKVCVCVWKPSAWPLLTLHRAPSCVSPGHSFMCCLLTWNVVDPLTDSGPLRAAVGLRFQQNVEWRRFGGEAVQAG